MYKEEEGDRLRAACAAASSAVIDLENDDGIQLRGDSLQGLLDLLSDSQKIDLLGRAQVPGPVALPTFEPATIPFHVSVPLAW